MIGECPFARNPDMTGCDRGCTLPRPKGFWATVKWLFSSRWCTSGPGGCGNGSLPCDRYDEWRFRRD